MSQTEEPVRTLPQALDAERSILAAMLLDPASLEQASSELTPELFYRVAHQRIFSGLRELVLRGEPAGLVTLTAELRALGELEAVGGTPYLTTIMEYAAASVNLAAHARILRDAAARRRAILHASTMVEKLYDPATPLEVAMNGRLAELAEVRDSVVAPEERHRPLIEVSITNEQMIAADFTPPPSAIGTGYIVRGEVTILTGLSGLGKTFGQLQMMRSKATGTPWLGHACDEGRCGMIQLEMTAGSIRERILPWSHEAKQNCDFITMPMHNPHFANPRDYDEICEWITRGQQQITCIDPAHLFNGATLNTEEDAGRFLIGALGVARETGTALVIVHHVNKMQFDKGVDMRQVVQMSLRGSSRLQNDPATIIGLALHNGQLLLINAKTRHCQSVESVPLRRDGNGYFTLGPSAEESAAHQRSETVEKIVIALDQAGTQGATMAELMATTKLSRSAVHDNIGEIKIFELKEGREVRRWLWAHRPAPQEGF